MSQAPPRPARSATTPRTARQALPPEQTNAIFGARTTAQLSDALRYLAGFIGIAPPGAASDPNTPPGTVTFGPEVRITAGPGEQNALVLDTPQGQSSVIHLKREGSFHWAILVTATEPASFQVVRYTPDGDPAGPPVFTVDFATGAVDFGVMPTVGGQPLVPTAEAPTR